MKTMMIALLFLLANSARADQQSDGNTLYERFVRWGFENQLDSVEDGKEEALTFFADNGQWEHYYFVATLAIQMKMLDEDNPGAALRELQQLYAFATDNNHDYGRASVQAQAGWLYGYIGDHEEAARQLGESIEAFRRMKVENRDVLAIYYVYAYVLELTGRYDEQQQVIDEGKQLLDKLSVSGQLPKADQLIADELLNTEALMLVHRGNLAEALPLIEQIEARLADGEELSRYEALRAVAEYRLANGEYDAALKATTLMEQELSEVKNAGLRWGLNLLQTEILRQLGHSDEAYDLLRSMMDRRSSASVSQLRRQLSEMDSQYQIDEMRIQEQKNHFWWAVVVSLIIIVALAVFAYFRQATARLLSRKNRELADALEHARESDRMKTAFVQHVSHEIRTPLNIITGFAQIVGNPDYELSDADRSRMLADIGHNTTEITNLVNELLELSESESQTQYAKTDDVDIGRLCCQVLAETEGQNTARLQTTIENLLPPGFVLRSNATALHKILSRLMNNALKFTEQGSVRMLLALGDGHLTIAIEDTGIGIPPEQQEKVFERFYKVDSFKQGIGLGLTVARRTAELLGGTLTIDPAYTAGARFVLCLPA